MSDLHLPDQRESGTINQSTVPWVERQGIPPLLFAFLVLILIFFLYQVIGGFLILILFGIEPLNENIFGYRLATGLGQILLILLPTLVLVRLATNQPKAYLRIAPSRPSVLLLPLIGIISLQQMLQIYMVFQERLPLPQDMQSVMEKFQDLFENLYLKLIGSSSVPELLWVITVVALIPALAEELMFRGLIQRSMEKSFSPLKSILITGFIFGAYHMNPFSFIPLVVIGIYLGFILIRSGSIWVPILSHFVNNAFACVALYFQWKDDYMIVGNTGEMSTTGLLATFWLFGVIFLLSSMYFIKITGKTGASLSRTAEGSNQEEDKNG